MRVPQTYRVTAVSQNTVHCGHAPFFENWCNHLDYVGTVQCCRGIVVLVMVCACYLPLRYWELWQGAVSALSEPRCYIDTCRPEYLPC